ncbi:MAG TPA: response regulator [Streptosporangiaceae bacterium]|nr:response regulator [Streptosporangiaceae bacterium]
MTGSGADEARGRILVVEDDLVTARFLTHLLGDRGGFDVTHTPDPGVALEYATSQIWDLVLTDVEMPGMTGLEMLQSLRQVRPDLPVAVLTAHASVDNAVRALRNHADEFLSKTMPPDQILASVASLVARGRAARQSVLAIGAHPDDVEIGAAGTLLVHRDMGHEISILTLSGGGADSTRAAESEAAARALGATLYLEDLEDSRISEGDPTISVIGQVVEVVRPTVIYTHSVHDVHQDHRNVHRAAMVAVREVGRVFCFQTPSATVEFRPARFVTIDEQLDRKILALQAFVSQVEVRAYLEQDIITSTARYWSRFGDAQYAEAFEVIRESAMSSGQPGGPARDPLTRRPDRNPAPAAER